MARAIFVKKARKDNPVAKAGESYWWWSFRFGGKHYSKEQPKRWQLTQSNFNSTIWRIEDEQIQKVGGGDSVADLEAEVDDIKEALEALREETQDSLDNMPEGLQEGDTGQMLQERIDAVEEMENELESIYVDDYEGPDFNPDEDDVPEEFDDWRAGKCEEIMAVSYGGP